MRRALRYLVCLVTMLFVSGIASAQVTEAQDSLVTIRDHNFINTLSENGTPSNLGKGQIYLLARVGAAFENLTVLAAPSEDPRKLAEAVQQASGIQEVRYSRDEEFTAVLASRSNAHLFGSSEAWDFDLGTIVKRLQADGWKVFGGVTVGSYVNTNAEGAPLKELRNVRTLPLESFTQHPVHLEATVGPKPILLMIIVVFGPFLGLVFGFLASLVIAKNKSIEITARRKLFQKVLRAPMFSLMGLSVIVSLFAIFTKQLTPAIDVWFASSQEAGIIIPMIMPMMLLSILAIIPMSKVEQKLFSTAPDSEDFKPAELVPIVKADKRLFWGLTIGIMVAASICYFATMSMSRRSGLRPFLTMASYGVLATSASIAGRIVVVLSKDKLKPDSQDPLAARALRMAEQARCPVWSVEIQEPRDQIQAIYASIYSGKLTITRRAIDELPEATLDFGIAYSLVTKIYMMMVPLFLGIFLLAGLDAFVIMPKVREMMGVNSHAPLLLPMILPMMLVIFPFMWALMRWDSRRKVRDALKIVPNYAAAKEWFERSSYQSPAAVPSKKQEKFRAQTLKDIDAISKEMGLL